MGTISGRETQRQSLIPVTNSILHKWLYEYRIFLKGLTQDEERTESDFLFHNKTLNLEYYHLNLSVILMLENYMKVFYMD